MKFRIQEEDMVLSQGRAGLAKRVPLILAIICLLSTVAQASEDEEVDWIHEESGTKAVVVRGGRDLLVTSAKHGYRLVLPLHGSRVEYLRSEDTPLMVRTDRYSVSLTVAPSSDDDPETFLRLLYDRIKSDEKMEARSESLLLKGGRPILRYMVRFEPVPDGSSFLSEWRWSYVTAVPSMKEWLILQVSAGKKAKLGREPRDADIRQILREGFQVTEAEMMPVSSVPALDEDAAVPDVDSRSSEIPPEVNPECITPRFAMEADTTPPSRIRWSHPKKPKGSPRGQRAVILIHIDESGKVVDAVTCTTNDKLWARSVVKDVKKWLYAPATRNGRPVQVQLFVEIRMR